MFSLKIVGKYFLKGSLVGIGAVIPGVSGGTVAMTVGVFEDIIESTANIFKHLKKSIIFLLPILLGACFGAYIISFILKPFNQYFPTMSKFFYCVLSSFSAILFAKYNLNGKKHILTFLLGIICAIGLSVLFGKTDIFNMQYNLINLFVLGFPLSLALVLPAISFSYMLLYFGIYHHFVDALNSMNFTFLFPMIMGIVLGSFLFSKLFLKLISRFEKETYSFVFGFIIYSIIDIILKI